MVSDWAGGHSEVADGGKSKVVGVFYAGLCPGFCGGEVGECGEVVEGSDEGWEGLFRLVGPWSLGGRADLGVKIGISWR